MSWPPGATHYEVLGVGTDATAAEIRAAYREVVKRAHPDHGGDAAAFRRLREAYETLGDDDVRRRYDDDLGVLRPQRGASRPATEGWQGQRGDFTGDVEFPGYLGDVVSAPWEPPSEPRPPEPEPVLPAQVSWWWPGHGTPRSATRRPVVVGRIVVVAAHDHLVGLDATDGRELWTLDVEAEIVAGPVVARDLVLVGGSDGVVTALDPARGVVPWRTPAVTPGRTRLAVDPVAGAVAVAGGRSVRSLDPATGAPGRALTLGGLARTLAVVGTVAVASTDAGALEGHDLERRRRSWSIKAGLDPDVAPESSDVGVWLAPPGGHLVLIDPPSATARRDVSVGASVAGLAGVPGGVVASVSGPPRIVRLDEHGRILWTCPTPAVGHAPAVSGRQVHVVGVDAVLRTIDLMTGSPGAESMLSFVPAGPPTAAPGQVLVVDRDGTVWSLVSQRRS